MGRCYRAALGLCSLGLIIHLAGPTIAAADPPFGLVDQAWCVDPAGTTTDWIACNAPMPCTGTFSTISDALAAAAVAPDPDPSDPPAHTICVATPATPHTESFVIENSSGALGTYVGVQFIGSAVGTNWCDDGQGASSAGITVVGEANGDTQFEVIGLRTDTADCGRTRPVLDVQKGFGALVLSIVRGGGTAMTGSAPSALEGTLILDRSLLDAGTGSAMAGSISLWTVNSVISGFSSSNESILQSTIVGGQVLTQDTVLFGSVVSASALLYAAGQISLHRTHVGSNVVYDAPLVEVQPLSAGGPLKQIIADSEFAENRLLTTGSGSPSAVTQPMLPIVGGPDICLPTASQGFSFANRAAPVASGSPSDQPLILLGPHPGVADSHRVYRTFFVDNELGSLAAHVRFGAGHFGSQLFFLHNVVSASNAPVISAEPGGNCSLHTARNLLLGTPFNELGSTFDFGEMTLDAFEDESQWLLTTPPGLYGPSLDLDTPVFESAATVLSEDDCARSTRLCPENGVNCSDGFRGCTLLGGTAYHLAAPSALAASAPWPWASTMLESTDPNEWTVGPEGWLCGTTELPSDNVEKLDGDGFTDLVDCDNLDASVFPVLPALDGYSGPWCDPAGEACYVCPPGSCWPPGVGDCPELPAGDDDDSTGPGDDDDSTAGPDDDDSATNSDDDDSMTAGGDDDDSAAIVQTGCGRGCGVTLGGGPGSAILGFLLLGVARRRD